jgi:hypothetical protein
MKLVGSSTLSLSLGLLISPQTSKSELPSLNSFKRENYHYNSVISGYHSNEFSSVKTLYERKLCCRSGTSEHYVIGPYVQRHDTV